MCVDLPGYIIKVCPQTVRVMRWIICRWHVGEWDPCLEQAAALQDLAVLLQWSCDHHVLCSALLLCARLSPVGLLSNYSRMNGCILWPDGRSRMKRHMNDYYWTSAGNTSWKRASEAMRTRQNLFHPFTLCCDFRVVDDVTNLCQNVRHGEKVGWTVFGAGDWAACPTFFCSPVDLFSICCPLVFTGVRRSVPQQPAPSHGREPFCCSLLCHPLCQRGIGRKKHQDIVLSQPIKPAS